MKKKFITAYSIFVSIIFIFAVCIFGYNLFVEYSNGETRADSRFEQLSVSIKQVSIKKQVGSRDFYSQLEEIIGSYDDFAALQITYNNEIIFAYPQLNIEEINNTKFIKNYTQSFLANDLPMTVSGKLYTLRPSAISKYARVSFLIILLVTIITILVIILLNVTEKSYYSSQEESDEDNSESNIHTVNEILDTTQKTETTPITQITPTAPIVEEKYPIQKEAEKNESTEKQNNDKVIININLDSNAQANTEAAYVKPAKSTKENAKLPVEDVKPMAIEKENPKGLFSPETGLGWESYFKTRLENELNRAISSEIDLALFLIKIPGLERNCAVIKKICDYLITQFQFKDLLFEYKNDSIAAIKLGTNTDQALTLAETINADINELLKDYPTKSFIGISNRTIRMMSAERLLKEADEALAHAQEDEDSPIIAFRADAIKYQKFLETENNAC
jgi:GGDEF domain-containing protein